MNCSNTTINLLPGECTTNFSPNIISTAVAPGYTLSGGTTTTIGTMTNGVVTQTGGPTIGTPLSAGTYTLTFSATDPGLVVPTVTCSMTVTVVNYENQPGNVVNHSLLCNQLANISLDEDCKAPVTPGMVLVGGPLCLF
ncbi:MAG: hypothetical protein IPQ04_01795 [Saprospiraceae bacterium]|nr:hypothetical protein [Saprospiraceae bacterium]